LDSVPNTVVGVDSGNDKLLFTTNRSNCINTTKYTIENDN